MILDDLAAATRARVEKKKNEVSFEAVKKQAMELAQKETQFDFPFVK